jgi:hypothetical protein
MKAHHKYIGLDVHKEHNEAAIFTGGGLRQPALPKPPR